jgi:copper transport protein
VRVERTPSQVRLVLSAPVEEAFLRLEALDEGGAVLSGPARRDPRDARAIIAPLAPGAEPILVLWRVLSQDGHPGGGVTGATRGFTSYRPPPAVGSPVRSDHGPSALIARGLAIAGPLVLLGLAGLLLVVTAPAVREGGVHPPGEAAGAAAGWRERAGASLERSGLRWWWAVWGSLAAWAAGVALLPVALLRGLRAGDLGTLLTDTRAGTAWWVELAGLLAAVAVAAWARGRSGGGLPAPAVAAALAAGPAAALVAVSWGGHASTGGDRLPNVVIDALHSGASAVWLGGLVGLLALWPAVLRLAGDDRLRLGAGVVVRFSALALTAVTVIVVTGVYRLLAEIGSPGDLVDTGYGRALLVKLGLFAVLLCFGGYNRLVLHPRMERAALGLDPDDRGATAALGRSVRAELALAALVLGAVAVLVSLPPAT